MDVAAIVSAWFFGLASGSLVTVGAIGVVTGRMPFNPTRIDWSEGEAKALGAVLAGQGLAIGLVALVLVLQWVAYQPPWLLLIVPITAAGFIGISFVGHHHNGRNPLNRW